MCFAKHVIFARLGAQSVAPQRRAFTRRAAQRRVQRTRYVHNVFTEPTGRNSVPARANIRRTRTRNAHYSIRIDQFHSGFPTSYIVDSLFSLTVDC